MYILELTLRNLRCFESASLQLRYPGEPRRQPLAYPNINLLLGNNGAGKTTILKALALAALSPVIDKSGYLPYYMVRRGSEQAHISAKLQLHSWDLPRSQGPGQAPRQEETAVALRRMGDVEILQPNPSLSDPSLWREMFEDRSPAFLLVGYGATRRVQDNVEVNPKEQARRRLLRYTRVAGLFEDHVALVPLASWLPPLQKANPGRFKQVIGLLNRLLPPGTRFTGKREHPRESGYTEEQGDYLYQHQGVSTPFGALSDGYRAYVGWIADLLYHIWRGCPSGMKLVENQGLVLVDEIDLHLHPEWQRSVIPTVSSALPNLQFVFTTHSPIVAGSLSWEHIHVMESAPSGPSKATQIEEPIHGLNAQQVLLSPYFGLSSTRAIDASEEIQKLSRRVSVDRPDLALALMKKMIGEETAAARGGTRAKQTTRKTGARRKAKSRPKAKK